MKRPTIRAQPVDELDIGIRPLANSEVERLEQQIRRPPGMHRERLALQQAGSALYFVVWLGTVPIGHMLLKARRLYTRNGFRDSGLGTYPIKWTWIDDAGEGHPQEEVCAYLIKTLDKEE